jgi:hypothetical protein
MMVNNSTNINKTTIGEVVDHHCLEVGSFVDIGEVVGHHCLEVGSFVDIGEVVDHHCLEVGSNDGQQLHQYQQNYLPLSNDGQQLHQYQQNYLRYW